MNPQDQTVDEFAHWLSPSYSRLTVCSRTPCYEIRGARGNRRLVLNGQVMTPDITFSVRSLSAARLKERQVVIATLSFSFDGKNLANVLAAYIVNSVNQNSLA